MSGGEQQMLAFAMALMTRPSLLLLDEPTTGLSPVMANLVLDTVDRITTSFSIALLVVEHNVPRTLRIVDRALIMKSGRLLSGHARERARRPARSLGVVLVRLAAAVVPPLCAESFSGRRGDADR